MGKYFKFLILLFIIINFTTNVGYASMQVPNDNKTPTQEIDRLQKIKEKGVLTVLSSNAEPYSYKNPRSNAFIGIDADIIREVAKRLGVKEVVARYTLFNNLFADLYKDPEIDLIVDGIYITDERKQLADFTIPIYSDWDAILTRNDSGIKSKEDLKNATVGTVEGLVYVPIVEKWKKEGVVKNYKIFSGRNDLTIALKNKSIDALLNDFILVQNIFLKNPESNFKLLSPNQYKPERTFYIGYPIKKGDTTLLNAINGKLQEMKDDGTLYDILARHGLADHYVP